MANKILILLIGLLLGIIVGGGTFWYLSGTAGKNVFIVNHKVDNKNTGKPDGNAHNGLTANKKAPAMIDQVASDEGPLPMDSLSIEEEMALEAQSIERIHKDSTLLAISSDSFNFNSFTRKHEEDIVVKKDELLFAAHTYIINLDQKAEEPSPKNDSLLSALSGIKEPGPPASFTIEFWKSPINYRGYKMGRNKLILFGIQSVDSPKVFKLHDVIYLRNGDKYYKIDKITDFRAYEPVNDPYLINQLSQ